MNAETDPYDSEMPYIPPSRWPLTFGVIAIVFGVLGLLTSLFQIAQYVFYNSGFMSKAMAANPQQNESREMMEGMFSVMEEVAPKVLVAQGILAVLALVLLVSGILLLMRRRVASPVIQTWAVLKIIGGGFAIFIGWQVMNRMQAGMCESIAASSPSGAPSVFGVMEAVYKVVYILQFLWLATLPVLFLIWLNREEIKRDLKEGAWK